MKSITIRTRLSLGSVLSTFGALVIVLSLLLGWTAVPRPWGFFLGFVTGVITGLGAILAIAGLIEYRHSSE